MAKPNSPLAGSYEGYLFLIISNKNMTHGSFPIYSYIINLDLKELINLEAFPIFVLLMFSFVCSLKIAIIYIMKELFLFICRNIQSFS